MALSKEITLDNGIKLNYHRIVSVNKITNTNTVIEIASYINEKQRQKEIEYYEDTHADKVMNVYIDTNYINKEYNEEDTIKELYEYLKTTEKFKDALDV